MFRQDDQTAHVEALLVGVVKLWILGARERIVPQEVRLDEYENNRVLPEFLESGSRLEYEEM